MFAIFEQTSVPLYWSKRLRGNDETINLPQRCHFELLSRNSKLHERKTKGQKVIDCSVSLNSEKEKAKNTSSTATF